MLTWQLLKGILGVVCVELVNFLVEVNFSLVNTLETASCCFALVCSYVRKLSQSVLELFFSELEQCRALALRLWLV